MKVLFLDIDGVLNSHDWYRRRKWIAKTLTAEFEDQGVRWRHFNEFDPTAVDRLNSILEQTGAKVVVSSTWRLCHEWEELLTILRSVGVNVEGFIGHTPDGSTKEYGPLWAACERGTEIQMWRAENEHAGPFAVLDDDGDMCDVRDRFVQTSMDAGLLDSHVERVVAMLNEVLQ